MVDSEARGAVGVSEPKVDADAVRRQYRYELLTWPEINEAVAQGKTIVLPVASVEQHGHHLPLDVDTKLASSVCYEAARRAPEVRSASRRRPAQAPRRGWAASTAPESGS